MRIITGKYRGRKLFAPNSDAIRPTSDKVKEAVFDTLQWEIRGSRVLDLFAGSGALGIEAVSRGAEYVMFSDNSRESVLLIEKNLQRVDYNGQLVKRDFRQTLDYVNTPFDVIFVDPPYDSGFGTEAVRIILQRKLLSDKGVIVFEHRSAAPLDEILERDDVSVRIKKYGLTTSVLFIRWKKDDEETEDSATDEESEESFATDEESEEDSE